MSNDIAKREGGLYSMVSDFGSNFSQGQRQLLCIARALLRDTKIVLLDEATSSIGSQTETLIQSTIRECFTNKTVIIVAHRLESVIHCDRVLVLGSCRPYKTLPQSILPTSQESISVLIDGSRGIPRAAEEKKLPPRNSEGNSKNTVVWIPSLLEYDSPKTLIYRKESTFRKMVEEGGQDLLSLLLRKL